MRAEIKHLFSFNFDHLERLGVSGSLHDQTAAEPGRWVRAGGAHEELVMTRLDVVDATLRCAARLEELGMIGWSQKLALAVEAASTGGELVMAARWHLQELDRSGEQLPEDVRRLIRGIIHEINKSGW